MSEEKTYYDQTNMENDRERLVDKGKVYYQLRNDSSTVGRPLNRRTRLLVTLCILLTEMCERLTFYSLVANIVLFGNTALGYTETDATTINQVFGGFVMVIPIFGGFISDSYAGRYKTILGSALIYLIGLVLIPASAIEYENWHWGSVNEGGRRALFLSGLVFVAIGTGGIKANVGPFGAEQVETMGNDAVQTFFNWFYWVINVGAFIAYAGVSYIQQEISFAWGFFVPLLSMTMALIIFVCAKRYYVQTKPKGSIFVAVFAICRQGCCQPPPPSNPKLKMGSEKKILARAKESYGGSYSDHLVDGVTSVIKVIPFCLLVIVYWALYAQMPNTFFVQGTRMDVRLDGGVNVPVAALNVFNTVSIILLIPLVDRGLYPFFQYLGRPLTYLKRIGIGMVIAALAMFVAGIVEIERKKGDWHVQVLSNKNYTASSLSVFAQVPQFALVGASEIFTSITALEFAYNQAPVSMQGVLTGLFLAASGIGSWVSTAILRIVEETTASDPWWSNEINDAHMEYLMFLFGILMIVNFIVFCVVAHFYSYQDPSAFEEPDKKHEDALDHATTDFGADHPEKGGLPSYDNDGYGSVE